jgi:replicative DNA helicase
MLEKIDPETTESLLIASCINNDKTHVLMERGITPDGLVVYGDVLGFVFDYNKKYNKNPEIDTVRTAFPSFPDIVKDNCDFDFLVDIAIQNGKKKRMKEVMDRMITLNSDSPDKAIEYGMAEISNIEKGIKVSASYFDGDPSGRIDRYLKRRKRVKAGYRVGLPTGIPQLDQEFVGFVPGDFVIVAGPPSAGKCLTGDTEIVDARTGKIFRIDEINNNSVFVLNEDNLKTNVHDNPILIKQGKKDVYTITTKTRRSCKATLNHPFLTINGWKMMSELKVGDRIAVPKEIPIFGNYKIEDWKVKFLGYMIGDGCMSRSPQFSNSDKNVMSDFIGCIKEFGDKISIHADGTKAYVTRESGYKWSGKQHHSNSGNWLYDLGLLPEGHMYSREKYLPEFVFEMSKEKICILLAALWDTDGEVNGGKIGYATISDRLRRQVAHLMLRLGIITYGSYTASSEQLCKFYDTVGKYMISYKKGVLEEYVKNSKEFLSRSNREQIDLFPKFMWDVVLSERPQKFIDRSRHSKEYCSGNWMKGRGLSRKTMQKFAEKYNSDLLRKYVDSDVIWDSIRSIEYAGIEETYDLSLSKYHNFIANDIFVHNSWTLLKMCSLSYFAGCRILYISPEMCEEDISLRLHSIMGRNSGNIFSNEQLTMGNLDDKTFDEYKKFLDELGSRNDWIIIDEIEGGQFTISKIEGLIKTYNPNIIAVDSIILMTATDGSPAISWQSLIDVAYGLKMLATRTKTIVIATAPTDAGTFDSTNPATMSELGLSKNIGYAIDLGISISLSINQDARNVAVFKKRKGKPIFDKQEVPFLPDVGIIGV